MCIYIYCIFVKMSCTFSLYLFYILVAVISPFFPPSSSPLSSLFSPPNPLLLLLMISLYEVFLTLNLLTAIGKVNTLSS